MRADLRPLFACLLAFALAACEEPAREEAWPTQPAEVKAPPAPSSSSPVAAVQSVQAAEALKRLETTTHKAMALRDSRITPNGLNLSQAQSKEAIALYRELIDGYAKLIEQYPQAEAVTSGTAANTKAMFEEMLREDEDALARAVRDGIP